ncbi:DNA-directed RNA polymerase subunit F [Candidatus Micrarchaeota archaeon]|nr:DNA-directed RNA polymerase subunit F [Candidatus Micrarchaeota archaeon]
MEVKSSEPIAEAEIKNILGKRKETEELAYEQAQVLEHAERFAEAAPAKARKLVEEIRKNEKIPAETAMKIVDTMPKRIPTLKAILIKEKVELSDEELDAVLKLITK